ncbi:MAG: hypothetical protein GY953_07315, partial [bacterium]|nr:hypothetical protein [bacterium]
MRPPLFVVPPVLLLLAGCSPERGAVSSDAFARKALPAVPVEEPYDFNRALTEGREPQWTRDPDARPGPDEMALPSAGWTLLLHEDASPVLRLAARQFRDYLGTTLETEIAIDSRQSLADWSGLRDTIVAGTGYELAGCATSLKAPKDYRLTITPSRIVVCGFDAAGAAYGLYNLEARMKLREAPILPAKLDTVRHSLYQARFTLSGLGWMEWPDPYLALLPRYGFDSIFASVYVNPNGVSGVPPGGVGRFPPYWDKWKEGQQTPDRMHDLIDRAARFGLDVYGQIIFLYTGEPGFDEAALRKLVRDLVTEFPEIRGYILLTEGFAYETWFGAGGKTGVDLLDWAGNWVRLVNIVTEECHRVDPDIEILVWEYNVPFRPDFVNLKAQITGLLPSSTIPLLTFENGKSFELDGHRSHLRDYSISQAGPAEVTEAQIAVAKKRGMRAVYSKADTWASWQFGTSPYIPAPYQWHARYEALEEHGIDGTLESWSYGFKPNFIAELRTWYSWSN